MSIKRMVNLIAFKLPYSGIHGMTKVCGKKRREIWNKLPFRKLKSPTILPDGNIIICSWEDHPYECNVYHNSPFDRFFKPQTGDVIVDVGAHVGFYTLKAANEVGSNGCVIAIEPEDKNYELLTTNIRINKYKNIKSIKSALSDFKGKARFFLKARSCSHSLIGKTWITPIVGSTEVTVTTLDNLLEELDIPEVDILKINVEGAELKVLKGSRKFLSKKKISKIVATPHPPYQREANQIGRYLKEFGYKIKIVDGGKILYASLT